jgi:predicted RNA-binding Zn ribbon-like protein
METRDHLGQFKLVGGVLVLDFLNTGGGSGGGPGDEALKGYGDLVAWARRAGTVTPAEARHLAALADADAPRARATYRRALRLRRELATLLGIVTEGTPPTSDQVAALRRDEADALAHAELVARDGGFEWAWPRSDDLARPLWPVVHSATSLLVGGPLGRVKRCRRCAWWFLDESKNRSRRWCSMEDCGTAVKMEAYVARRAARRAGAASGQDRSGGAR